MILRFGINLAAEGVTMGRVPITEIIDVIMDIAGTMDIARIMDTLRTNCTQGIVWILGISITTPPDATRASGDGVLALVGGILMDGAHPMEGAAQVHGTGIPRMVTDPFHLIRTRIGRGLGSPDIFYFICYQLLFEYWAVLCKIRVESIVIDGLTITTIT